MINLNTNKLNNLLTQANNLPEHDSTGGASSYEVVTGELGYFTTRPEPTPDKEVTCYYIDENLTYQTLIFTWTITSENISITTIKNFPIILINSSYSNTSTGLKNIKAQYNNSGYIGDYMVIFKILDNNFQIPFG